MNEALDLRWATYDVVHETPGKAPAAVAKAIGVTHKYLLDAANPHLEQLQLQARLVGPLTLATGNDAVLQAICAEAGYLAIPRRHVTANTSDVIGVVGELARESGESITAICRAIEDGIVCAVDALAGRRELDELIRKAECLKELLAQKVTH